MYRRLWHTTSHLFQPTVHQPPPIRAPPHLGSLYDLLGYCELHTQLRKEGELPKAIMLVGNRKDIVDDHPSRRIMTGDEGKDLAKQIEKEYGLEAKYIETSDKTGHNVDELFQNFVRYARAVCLSVMLSVRL